ncbi:hypothetical protein [Neobacillus sp. OS1-33]|uniref:hypothetical protein n=1 Tax=Neobacillus sp. OS1-33 TaxID=3070683 RepID=UPI0027E1AAB0|nr:hypothetical protein [Neobacillus sp. OS1-33]WML26440.1 hypothetical protein RCG22_02000 [Neobacillus sp. OS1-33]
MAKKKNKSNNTPRRKQYNQTARLQNAKKWVEQYNGKNIAKGYSNWFGVDLLCAIKELELLGYKFKQSYKENVKQSLIARQKQRERRKREKEREHFNEGFESFYFIEGFTSNCFPYGVTLDEINDIEDIEWQLKRQDKKHPFIEVKDIPF